MRIWCIGFSLIVCISLLAQSGYCGAPAEGGRSWSRCDAQPLPRPSPEFMYDAIRGGRALITEPFHTQAADLLLQMDRVHSDHLGQTNVTVLGAEAATGWIEARTARWPMMAPPCERAIWALLQLQIDMLQRIVRKSHPALAAEFEEGAKKWRVRRSTERFFKDFRDRFICEVLDALGTITRLQAALGVRGAVNLDFPVTVKTTRELQAYLVEKIRIATDRAHSIRS